MKLNHDHDPKKIACLLAVRNLICNLKSCNLKGEMNTYYCCCSGQAESRESCGFFVGFVGAVIPMATLDIHSTILLEKGRGGGQGLC